MLWAQLSPGAGGSLSCTNSHPSVEAQANVGFSRMSPPAGESHRQCPRRIPQHLAPTRMAHAGILHSFIHPTLRRAHRGLWEGVLQKRPPHPCKTQGGERHPLLSNRDLRSTHPKQLFQKFDQAVAVKSLPHCARHRAGACVTAAPVICLGHRLLAQPSEASHLLRSTARGIRNQVQRELLPGGSPDTERHGARHPAEALSHPRLPRVQRKQGP